MKVSVELLIFAAIGAVFGWLLVPDHAGKFIVFTMAFIVWIASRICTCIERASEGEK